MADNKDFIYGFHSVLEALEAGRDVDKILLKRDLSGYTVDRIVTIARERDIPVQRVPIEKINRLSARNHQGVLAMMAAVSYTRLEQVLPAVFEGGENPFIVVLDGVTDVRNFGAIARTCDCAGVNAIVIPQRGSVSVGADAVKTSAGALNYIDVCRELDIKSALRLLRDSGVKIVGTSDKSDKRFTTVDYTGPVALVLGAEGEGMSDEASRLCDELVAIPEFGHINSLNVSVAGGIMMYEVVRQRLDDGQTVE